MKIDDNGDDRKKVNKKLDDEIRVLSADDEKIKTVGEVLANDSSRSIMRLLSNEQEMTINQIAKEMDLSIPLVSHHLKKMQDTGVVKVSRIGKSVKGQEMKYYAVTNQSFLITPPEKQTHSLLYSLRKFSKFAAIGMAGLVSWSMLRPQPESQTLPVHDSGQADFSGTQELDLDEWSSTEQLSETKSEVDNPVMEPVPAPQPEPEPSQIDGGFDLQLDPERANTGSVSLDRTVYPEPFMTTGTESIEPLIFSIIIPIGIVIGGIILDRLLMRWYRQRKIKRSYQ
ncbi:MAG: winged helix-turn-helix transcriptional regulator [Nitrosarchaeum sp.]|nr:winged helix-turn-helix transcriptional regulator [Nitrosarchaeum sp.]MCA9820365.1 winged helix-turn-helix transcriptional regulator [Nitrosarchaeum sp.]